MCRPTNSQLAELRDILREILSSCTQENQEECVIAIISAVNLAYTQESDKMKRVGTAQAMMDGLNRAESVKSRLYERFRLNYSWNTKQGREMLEWFLTRPEGETVDKFADYWFNKDWRGKARQSPTLLDIYTNWPLAFTPPEEAVSQVPVFRIEEAE